jgi:hypothetical protein
MAKISNISCSPQRYSFTSQRYVEKLAEDPSDEAAKNMVDLFESIRHQELAKILEPEWQKFNMEYDLRSTPWILEKVKDENYAQNLYAAMCNNNFRNIHILELLKESEWSCSWRYAGGIIADMREEGDYMDWYCSGITDVIPSEDGVTEIKGYVSESFVTDEIREDLLKLGWLVLPERNNDF